MGIPTTYLSLHDVTDMKATVLQSFDSPLILTIDSPHGAMQISIYLRDLDTAKTEFLADVINAAVHEPTPPKATCPAEKAAYQSADDYWKNLKRDLDIGWDTDRNKTYCEVPSREDGKR
jgi:hypothetical protein